MALNRQMSSGNSVLMELENVLVSEVKPQDYTHHLHAENVLKGLYECYEQGRFCDVTLIAGNDEIKAHKVVLSSCSVYFKGLLDSHWNDSGRNAIVIEDFDAETLKCVLKFAYTGMVEVNRCNVLKLLTAADFLQLDFIKQSCGAFLEPLVNLENCLLLLATADKFNAFNLVVSLVQYIGNNYHHVSQSENFFEIPVHLFNKVLQSESLIVDKKDTFLPPIAEQEHFVLQSVLKFVSHQAEEIRKSLTVELLKNVRLRLLPSSCLDTLLENENVSSCSEAKDLVTESRNLNITGADATSSGEVSVSAPPMWAKQRDATKARGIWYKIHCLYHVGPRKLWFDDFQVAAGDGTYLTGMKLWMSPAHDDKLYICGMKLFYSNGATSLYGSHDTDDVEEFHLEDGERIVKATVGSAWALTSFTFHTSKGRTLGPFGDAWGDTLTEEPKGSYGFLGYMRGSVAHDSGGKLCIIKFSLMWKEFTLRGPYGDEFEDHGEVESVHYDSDSEYLLHPELLDLDDDAHINAGHNDDGHAELGIDVLLNPHNGNAIVGNLVNAENGNNGNVGV